LRKIGKVGAMRTQLKWKARNVFPDVETNLGGKLQNVQCQLSESSLSKLGLDLSKECRGRRSK
jgi:hypothetical protein